MLERSEQELNDIYLAEPIDSENTTDSCFI